ncbi:MAG: transposase [Emcibacter sp.]|nr:transposase [Emcibacter sp.]
MAQPYMSDEGWVVTGPLLPKQGRGPKHKGDRQILNGVFYISRTGAPRRDCRNIMISKPRFTSLCKAG